MKYALYFLFVTTRMHYRPFVTVKLLAMLMKIIYTQSYEKESFIPFKYKILLKDISIPPNKRDVIYSVAHK